MPAHTLWWRWSHDWNHHLKIYRLLEASLVNTLPSLIQNILSSPIPFQQVRLPRTHYVYQIWQQKKESVPRQSLSEAQVIYRQYRLKCELVFPGNTTWVLIRTVLLYYYTTYGELVFSKRKTYLMIFDDDKIIKIFKNYKNIIKGENPHTPPKGSNYL